MDELAPTRPIPTDAVEDTSIIDESLPFTMTGPVRLQAVIDAVRYCVRSEVPGAFVECGVWRGGSVLAMILTLQQLGAERDLFLYDTFEGMTEPTEHDVSQFDRPARERWEEKATANRGRPFSVRRRSTRTRCGKP